MSAPSSLPPASQVVTGAPRWLTYVRMSDVLPAVRNPRKHDLPIITESLTRFGFTAPMIADERTQRLVAGHGRIAGLVVIREAGEPMPAGLMVDEDGEWLVPLMRGWRSRNDAEAEAYIVMDNRANQRGSWDEWTLGPMLEDLNASDADLFAALDFRDEELEGIYSKWRAEGEDGEPASVPSQGPADTDAEPATFDSEQGTLDPDAPLVGGDPVERTVECPSCAYTFVPGRKADQL